MPHPTTTQRHRTCAALLLAASASLLTPLPAHAVDGCLVLLCFAAPSWRTIPPCVPPIKQVLRDLARGKSFPTCAMVGGGSRAANQWASAPDNCPPQYTHMFATEGTNPHVCDFQGAISVYTEGVLFARTWWTFDGDTSTEFTETAKKQLGTWDNRFDRDLQAWQAHQPATPPGDDGGR